MAKKTGATNWKDKFLSSPLKIVIVCLIGFCAYKILYTREKQNSDPVRVAQELPKLRRDFQLKELKLYDGTSADGRILIAVNGKVFDVTKGKRFYGPGASYSAFAGSDATRGLATSSVRGNRDEYDDLSDLSEKQMEYVLGWEKQFQDKYVYVGKLLRLGEQPTIYPEEDGDQ